MGGEGQRMLGMLESTYSGNTQQKLPWLALHCKPGSEDRRRRDGWKKDFLFLLVVLVLVLWFLFNSYAAISAVVVRGGMKRRM
jgi:hypothetical protein